MEYFPSLQPMLGTNPICFAAPAEGSDPFVIDMATSTAAVGKVTPYGSHEQYSLE